MPWSKEHKRETRERIVRAAADAFRERGIDGVGVADVMKQAGLTHGGFYAHFKSKDDLVKAAFEQMSREIADTVGATDYLAELHMRHPERGCPLPTVGTELARSGAKMRRSVAGESAHASPESQSAWENGGTTKPTLPEHSRAWSAVCLSRAPFPKMKAAHFSSAAALSYAARSAKRSCNSGSSAVVLGIHPGVLRALTVIVHPVDMASFVLVGLQARVGAGRERKRDLAFSRVSSRTMISLPGNPP